MYNPDNQYRCTIIRGKSQREIDDRLPLYAKIIMDVCPCSPDSFEKEFNKILLSYIPGSKKKTLDNHRTEIAGKLFGMYYLKIDSLGSETVFPSDRTKKFIEDGDQPAFFKDVCYKMQFPNGMSKTSIVRDLIEDDIKLRSCCYIVKILNIARTKGVSLEINDIGYYILNSKDVLQGNVKPDEVIEKIIEDRKKGITHKVHTEGKETSYDMQHIKEQLNYMELANLIIISDKIVKLNVNESAAISIFEGEYDVIPFDVSAYDLDSIDGRKTFQYEWDEYFSKLSDHASDFKTSVYALGVSDDDIPKPKPSPTTVEIGDQGEDYVVRYEKARVSAFNKKLVNRVLPLGKIKGLGFDIQSVVAEKGDASEAPIYIEVKTTLRTTEPDFESDTWTDTIRLTRTEWVTAQSNKSQYMIYRVYFVRGKVLISVIKNIYEKEKSEIITVTPESYVVDYKKDAIDFIYTGSE